MNVRLREALRRKIHRHNKFVGLYAVWSGFLIICMWFAIYVFCRWAVIFSRTLVHGVDAEPPGHFSWGFFVAIALWFLAAWFEQKRQPTYLRSNDRTLVEIFLELVLFPPRATLSAIRHARERVTLDDSQLDLATDLLDHLGRGGKVLVDTEEMADGEVKHEPWTEALRTLDLIYVRRVKGVDSWAITDPQRLSAFL